MPQQKMEAKVEQEVQWRALFLGILDVYQCQYFLSPSKKEVLNYRILVWVGKALLKVLSFLEFE